MYLSNEFVLWLVILKIYQYRVHVFSYIEIVCHIFNKLTESHII